jgi:hypothetical protein
VRWCVAAVLLASCASRHPFEPRGVATVVRMESTLDVSVTKKDSEGEKTMPYTIVKSETFRQSREDGGLAIVCERGEMQSNRGGGIARANTELHGRSFLVGPDGSVTPCDDGPRPSTAVGGWQLYTRLLPGRTVAEKAEWPVDADLIAILSLTHPMVTKSARLVATLAGVEGTRARIEFEGTVEGKTKDGSMVRLAIPKGKGELIFDTGTGRPVSIAVAADLELVKDVIHAGAKVGEIRTKSSKCEVRVAFE